MNDLSLILRDFLVDSTYCPSRTYPHIPIQHLIRLAKFNKAEHILLHFLTCPLCRRRCNNKNIKQLERLRFQLNVMPLIFKMESQKINSLLRNTAIGAILFKHNAERIRVGTDIDLLVAKKDFKLLSVKAVQQGYKKTAKVRHKEIQITNPKSGFKLDVHHIAAYPMFGGLTKQELHLIKAFTYDLLAFSFGKRGIVSIPLEWYIISRSIHYWYNDLLCGLYPLFEICSFCSVHQREIKWKKLFSIADNYSFSNEIALIFLLANKLLNNPIPDAVKTKLTARLLIAGKCIVLEDVVYFPPISRWYHKRYKNWAQKKYKKYFFIKLLTSQKIPIARLLRPRILLLITACYIHEIRKVIFSFLKRS